MKPVPLKAPGQLAEREVKFKGSSGKAISAQHRAVMSRSLVCTGVLHPVGSETILKVGLSKNVCRKSIHVSDYKSI